MTDPMTTQAPFEGELTILWATEKAEILRRIAKLEAQLDDIRSHQVLSQDDTK